MDRQIDKHIDRERHTGPHTHTKFRLENKHTCVGLCVVGLRELWPNSSQRPIVHRLKGLNVRT